MREFIQTKKYFWQILGLLIFLFSWEIAVKLLKISELLLPSPSNVFKTYLLILKNGLLFWHTWVTTLETLSGFIIGSIIGIILGYLLSKSKTLENIFSPFLVAIQTTPKLALAPLFLIWFGFGILSKIFITALIVFFTVFINTLVAIKSVNSNLKDVMRLTHASKWQIFTKLELPSSLPLLFAGFKSGITLAVVGAVVGEFIGANAGLGYLIIFAIGNLNTPMVFAAIIQLVIIGIVLYTAISVLGSKLMKWHESERNIY